MNKMTKGALATGLGVAVLVGGGGTLAWWNVTADAENAGTIVAGNMALDATAAGKWTNAKDKTTALDIAEYRVVPGDVLTFTQPVNVELVGDLLTANLAVTEQVANKNHLVISNPTLTDKDGNPVTGSLTPATDGNFTAAVTVTFPADTTELDGAEARTELEQLHFTLAQGTLAE